MPKTGMEPVRTKQVINAVLKCVADEGIDQVTLEKTAKMAGVSKGVVTYYFNNKEKLLIQSFKTFLTGYLEMIELGISSYLSEISSREMLLVIGRSTLGLYPGEGLFSQEECKKILMQLYSRLTINSGYKEMMNDVYNQYLEAMIQVLEYGIVNNEFNISDTKSTVIQLMALLDGLLIYSIIGFQGLNEDQFEIYKNFVDSL